MALKHVLLMLALVCFVTYGTAARELVMKWAKQDLANKLKEEEHGECWSNLIGLKSCSNEIKHFFINGQLDIGPNCCCAITVITDSCWPTMLTSLDLTSQEALYIRGYCDDSASAPALAPAPDGPANPIY